MPFLIAFCVVLHIITNLSSAEQNPINGTLVKIPLCYESGIRCADDCLTLLVCGQNSDPIEIIFCPATGSNTPFCSNNTCSSSIETCTKATTSVFQCTDSGLFPDPNDCTRYRQCKDVGILSDHYQCPLGYNFNSKIGLCDKTATCDIIDCSESIDQAVTFKSNPRFYAFCYKATSDRVQRPIYKCSKNLIFSLTTNSCIYRCASAGRFNDLNNCHAYFECSGTVGKFKWIRKVCPLNQFFDGTNCVMERSPCSSVFLHNMKLSTTSDEVLPTTDLDIAN